MINKENCVRGEALPIVLKSVFPNTSFVSFNDSLSGQEIIKFDNGDRLIILNSGCEWYTLEFRFETSRFAEDPANVAFWYRKSEQLMRKILHGIDAPINLKEGLKTLNSAINQAAAPLKYEEEYDFGGDEIRNIVYVDSAQKLSDHRYAVTISFSVGPL